MALGTPESRFFASVSQVGEDPLTSCWEWQRKPARVGYGIISIGGTQHYAHRWSWEFFNGPIPDGLHIDHLCSNRICVNPWHLDPVTSRVNSSRGLARTRSLGRLAPPRNTTHCRQGLHEWSEGNIYTSPQGRRTCLPCMKERDRAKYVNVIKPQRQLARQLNSEK